MLICSYLLKRFHHRGTVGFAKPQLQYGTSRLCPAWRLSNSGIGSGAPAKNKFFSISKKTLSKTHRFASTKISMAQVSLCPYHSVLPRKSPWCVRHPWGPLCWMNWSDACTTGSCCAWTKGPCTTWAVALDLCDSDPMMPFKHWDNCRDETWLNIRHLEPKCKSYLRWAL